MEDCESGGDELAKRDTDTTSKSNEKQKSKITHTSNSKRKRKRKSNPENDTKNTHITTMSGTTDKDIREAFQTFDTDNDGVIPAQEIGTVIRALGKAPLQSEVDALEQEAGDTPVDLPAFKKFYDRKFKLPASLRDDMIRAFRALDNVGNGTITEAELRVLLGTLGEALEREEIDSLCRCLEIDKEGNLSYEELVEMLVS